MVFKPRLSALRAGSLASMLLAGVLAGCSTIPSSRGYVVDDVEPSEIEAGVDTRVTVEARLGSPSITGPLSEADRVWIYLSSQKERRAYERPVETERALTTIRFNEDGVVEAVESYTLQDGFDIAFSDDETPTRGRQLGVLEQLFGTIGRNPLPPQDDRQPGQRRQ